MKCNRKMWRSIQKQRTPSLNNSTLQSPTLRKCSIRVWRNTPTRLPCSTFYYLHNGRRQQIGKAHGEPCIQGESLITAPMHSTVGASSFTRGIGHTCTERCISSVQCSDNSRHCLHEITSRQVKTVQAGYCGGNHTTGAMLT